jgi:hypothetical protein
VLTTVGAIFPTALNVAMYRFHLPIVRAVARPVLQEAVAGLPQALDFGNIKKSPALRLARTAVPLGLVASDHLVSCRAISMRMRFHDPQSTVVVKLDHGSIMNRRTDGDEHRELLT